MKFKLSDMEILFQVYLSFSNLNSLDFTITTNLISQLKTS